MARKNASSRSASSSRPSTEVIYEKSGSHELVGYEHDDEHSVERVQKLTDRQPTDFNLKAFLYVYFYMKWIQIQLVW
eukprot:CAMPEP_0177678430 /NCGR_PEP_ID=MMETSP0447-20121125/29004_1 /TAXON_ID=0 /ORGANISM="Stygamoeba regulata, Strain BSH-02190019" /LENGTH=76 /DNA_ID=CAMNT_0019187431 /DNA_START=37 /DNA_END=264 /DNA_ORIENTATION=-